MHSFHALEKYLSNQIGSETSFLSQPKRIRRTSHLSYNINNNDMNNNPTGTTSATSEWINPEYVNAYLEGIETDVPHLDEAQSTLLEEISYIQEKLWIHHTHRNKPENESTTTTTKGSKKVWRILDVGCGDGRLLDLVLKCWIENNQRYQEKNNNETIMPVQGIGIDFSPPMLQKARARFSSPSYSSSSSGNNENNRVSVQIHEHDLNKPLQQCTKPLGTFDIVVSSFAIHHCSHERKKEIYHEIYQLLTNNNNNNNINDNNNDNSPISLFCNLEHVASSSEEAHKRFVMEIGEEDMAGDESDQLLKTEIQLDWLREIGFEDVDCYWKWREMALLVGYKKIV